MKAHLYRNPLVFLSILCWNGLAEEVPCPTSLNCAQGVTTCEDGHADFSFHPQLDGEGPLQFHIDTIRDGAHCKCPEGLTGIECNHKFLSCDANHACYHGGRCIAGLRDAFGNTQRFCDCSNARDEDGNQYVGKYCERQVMEFCSQSHTSFCVNDGVCSEKFPQKGPPCICSEGFEGPHCEFKTGTMPLCTLECGEGYCQMGSLLPDVESTGSAEDYMQCVCPENFEGKNCEILKTPEVQHQPAEICTVGNRGPGRPLSFCLNNGSCLLKVRIGEEHPGCECPDGYTGNHCEMKVQRGTEMVGSDQDAPLANDERGDPSAIVALSSVVGATTLCVVILLVLRIRRRNEAFQSVDPSTINLAPVSDPDDLKPDAMYRPSDRRAPSRRDVDYPDTTNLAPATDPGDIMIEPTTTHQPSFHYPLVDIGPQRDEDGHDLHDIELI